MNKSAAAEANVIAPVGFSMNSPSSLRTGQAEACFGKAQQILRQEPALTMAQFEELDELFRKVSQPQFGALVDDPRHQRQLRSYEILVWRRGTPLPLILAAFVLAVAAAGTLGLRLSDRPAIGALSVVPSAEAAAGR